VAKRAAHGRARGRSGADITDILTSEISLDAPWRLVETFAEMPRWKPADVNKSADVIVRMLRKAGVPVAVHKPKIHLSIPFEARVTALGKTFRAKPPAYARDARDGVAGELVYVPAVFAKKIGALFNKNQDEKLSAAERIRGKIVISEGFAFPGKVQEFEQKGAIGVIAVNPGADAHWGICTSIWGTPDLDDLPRKPDIPVCVVNNPDGRALIALAKKSGRAKLFTQMEQGWYEQKVPEVVIPGGVEPEKFVLLHGHYDSWDVGVGDNATGDATLLELARVFWKHRGKLRRSVRICWWPGHSTGRYAGSTWYADAFAIDLDENCVAQVNCDSPGCRWASEFIDISWMPETERYCKKVIRTVTGLPAHGERPHRAGDYSFNNIGISSFFMLSSTMPHKLRAEKNYYAVGGCGGNIAWHTEHDRMDIADKKYLLRDMKVYAAAVAGVADAEVLPFDWTAITKEFAATLKRYQRGIGRAVDLAPAVAANRRLDRALRRFHAAIRARRIKPALANTVIERLARILVPINHTTTPRFRHDPALPVEPLPMLASAAAYKAMPEAKKGFAATQLVRGRNRLTAALREATRLVEAAR
jgi:hypothetical protein